MKEGLRNFLFSLLYGKRSNKFWNACGVFTVGFFILVIAVVFMINIVQGLLLVVFLAAILGAQYLAAWLVEWIRHPSGKE